MLPHPEAFDMDHDDNAVPVHGGADRVGERANLVALFAYGTQSYDVSHDIQWGKINEHVDLNNIFVDTFNTDYRFINKCLNKKVPTKWYISKIIL